ncbi:DNA-directed RNA polymerase subunit alpha [candidate division WWE3 bacterium CG_4_10_14_0_2_um_filter_42_7]|uniref:DNA-directed RNA polymerase subunit alpha n=2 Tax=Katanobacteria TaxID=422282 RepID=A0A2H0X8N3_UNCKA|nr:MAG: DNA-directed RNA polymerase subunit alpha [candidate division WWE3 bacterium CG08_land_8_20_14_0_20_41_15]PIZ43830.1 MAG: DNA-directed RNA polymerase subunit alpha [candidate division WWE3 bacterium CG_4_10_14_0_2_um_filter_42_7]
MIQPFQVNFKAVEDGKDFGVFCIGPLPRGYGYTLGSSLRRVLLSSLPGAAISQVKFGGTTHQFSTIKGVKEDGVELSLNLKRVFLKMHSDAPVSLEISKKGPGEVLASDIKGSPEVEIVNKDLVIAHLSDKSSLFEAELVAEKGTGYSLSEERKISKLGVIPLDCAFSPVLTVSSRVDKTRYLSESDLDQLVIEVKTNGAISPKEAIMEASKIVSAFFARLATGEETLTQEDNKEAVTEAANLKDTHASELAIEDVALPVRVINSLKKQDVVTIYDILKMGKVGLSKVRNLGEKSVVEIEKILAKEGFELK